MKREQDLFIEFGALPKKIIDFICNVAGNDAYLRANFAENQTVMRCVLINDDTGLLLQPTAH